MPRRPMGSPTATWTAGSRARPCRSPAPARPWASTCGVPYVIGGLDASGAPTDTVFQGVIEEGQLTGWQRADGSEGPEDLTLPRPLSDAAARQRHAAASCCWAVAARMASPPTAAYLAWVATDPPGRTLQPWEPLEGLALPEARAEAVAGAVGDYIYLVGGEGPDGATRQRLPAGARGRRAGRR